MSYDFKTDMLVRDDMTKLKLTEQEKQSIWFEVEVSRLSDVIYNLCKNDSLYNDPENPDHYNIKQVQELYSSESWRRNIAVQYIHTYRLSDFEEDTLFQIMDKAFELNA